MTDRGAGGHLPGVRSSSASARSTSEPVGTEKPSLERLYRDHAGFVWRTVKRLGIPEASAEDVVHEVFLVARRRLPGYEGRGAPTTWLYGIARGVCANWRRSRDRSKRRLAVVPPPPDVQTPEDASRRADAARLVQAFLHDLPRDQRRVFELCDIEGMSGPDVARALRVELNTVYSRLRLARKRFTQFLSVHGLLEQEASS